MTTVSPRRRKLEVEAISRQPEVGFGQTAAGFEEVQRYLRWFGYLPGRDFTRSELDTPTSEALRRYQEQHGLPATGVFDDPTRAQMVTPRCGLPDRQNGVAFSTTCSWDPRHLTFAFDTGTSDVPGTGAFDAVRAAFATWAAATPLTFSEVTTADSPHIRIGWRPADDPDLSMAGGTLAHADFPPTCSIVTTTLPKPVHFDDSENWVIGAGAGAFDVETVALHEIGHILGLAHSSVSGSVMFPSVSPNSTLRSLTPDDQQGIDRLYAERPWTNIGHANDVIGMAGVNGKLYCVTADARLWMRDPVAWDVDWVHIGHANDVMGMAGVNGKLYCATSDNSLWMRDPVPWDVDWVHIGHANDVVGMAGVNGKLYCATSDNSLWMRDPVPWDVDWVHIGHANDVVDMAGVNGKLYCATSDNNLWMRDPVPWDVDWVDIGHANDVVAMDAVNGLLFCATRDNRLWMRTPGP